MSRWRMHGFRTVSLLGVGLLVALAGAGSIPMARAEPLDSERHAQLDLGTVEQQAEVLAWLAEHGDQSAAHAVVLHLKDADVTIRGLAEQTLWAIWTRSGSDEVNRLMEHGIALMNERAYDQAITVFDDIVRRQPDFAEGYNKRATTYYVMGEYLRSLADVEATLQRNPEHFGALSGGGLCLLKLQRPAEALSYFERALAVNPNMDSIRFMAEQLRKQKPKPLI